MSPKQKKLAAKAPPPNKLDEKDFKVLREEKAKGRGMGLQDEKVKPGKVMKANLGILAMKKAKDKGAKGAEFLSPIAMAKRMFNKKSGGVIKAKRGVFSSGKISDMSFDEKMKRVESGQINKKTGKFTSMNAMRDAKGFQKGESAAEFNKRRMKLERAAKVAKSTRLGKILLPVVGAAVAAKTYLNSKMNKKKDVKKKMGGGMMMQKPMGYKSGMGPAGAAGLSAGRPGGRRPMTQGPKGGIGSLGKEKKENIPNIIITKGGAYTYTKPKVDEKKGRHLRQHKSYDASPRLISEAKGKTSSLRSMNVGGMMKKYSKGGGADTGTEGEYKSKIGVLSNKLRRRGMRLTRPDLSKLKEIAGKQGAANLVKRSLDILESSKKMGGGMMQKPMGYSKGVSVKARGCKLGRTRPTKIT